MNSPANFDLRNEPVISKKWNFDTGSSTNLKEEILITGANSFLGTHVIDKLQQRWKGKIHLLVRGENQQAALTKIENAFSIWKLGNFEPGTNIEIHVGEVCNPKMGLSNEVYEQLYNKVGYVLHLAMVPLYHLPYSRYQNQWIPELEQMIAFCKNGKSLHYPSSYNANFFQTDEDFNQVNSNAWQSGYAGFKWVANEVIQNAMNQGLNGCIYDIPLVVGSASKGSCPDNYSIWHVLDLFLESGCFIPYEFRIIPVDTLAEIIVENLTDDRQGKVTPFIRPVLATSITHHHFEYYATNWFGLHLTDRETMLKTTRSKRKFSFIIPENFYELLEKVNSLPPVLPDNFVVENLPDAFCVFLCNLNYKITESKYQKYFDSLCKGLN